MKTNSDLDIRQAVLQELTWDPHVEELSIGVAVEDAVVTLMGVVSADSKRHAAEDAVRRVVGVRSVINQLEVVLRGD